METLIKKYYAPTPARFRKIGDSLLFLFTALTPVVTTLPVSEKTVIWLNIGLSVAGLICKTVTNFFTEETT